VEEGEGRLDAEHRLDLSLVFSRFKCLAFSPKFLLFIDVFYLFLHCR
jgi:hypothetical protein